MSNLTQYLDQWAKKHPVYDPAQETDNIQNKIQSWLLNGGESPLPMWPTIKNKNEALADEIEEEYYGKPEDY